MHIAIEVVSERKGIFRVICTATGGTLLTSSLTGPGLSVSLELHAEEGSIGRTGQNTYSVTSDSLFGRSDGDTYVCRADNELSSSNSSIVLAGMTIISIPPHNNIIITSFSIIAFIQKPVYMIVS